MALNFPASPAPGQVYAPGGGLPSYQWNGAAWLNIGSGSVADSFAYTATGAEAGGGTIVPVTGGYLANLAIVTRNGALQTPGDDVNITSGTNVVFAAPLVAGETIYVLKFRAFGLLDALTKSQNGSDIPNKPLFLTNIGLSPFTPSILTAAGVANVDVVIPAGSVGCKIHGRIKPSSGGNSLYLEVSQDNGATFDNTNYRNGLIVGSSAVGADPFYSAPGMQLTSNSNEATRQLLVFTANVAFGESGEKTQHQSVSSGFASTVGYVESIYSGGYNVNGVVTNLRFVTGVGTFNGKLILEWY